MQRGTRGILKCEFKHKGAVSSVTWYKGKTAAEAEVVVRFFLGFKTGPKYTNGYDLAADNTTLVIEKVSDADAGTWWCTVVVTDPWTDTGYTSLIVTGKQQNTMYFLNGLSLSKNRQTNRQTKNK